MLHPTLASILLITLLPACAAVPTTGTALLEPPVDTIQRQAAAVERNNVDALRTSLVEPQDPYRHMRPYNQY